MALFSVENREVGNWSSEEDERWDTQLGELSGGVELHEGLFIGVERWWREGGSGGWSAGGLAAHLQWRGGGFGRRGAARSGGASGEAAQGDGTARAGAPVSKWRGRAARRGARRRVLLEQCRLGRRGVDGGAVPSDGRRGEHKATGRVVQARAARRASRTHGARGGTGTQRCVVMVCVA